MKTIIILLVSFFVVCITLQKTEAQNNLGLEIVNMNDAVKHIANMINMIQDIENNDYHNKFPNEWKMISEEFMESGKYAKKAHKSFSKHNQKKYAKNEEKALKHYTYGKLLYNEILKKEGKPPYQEISSQETIVTLFLFNGLSGANCSK